MCITFSAAPPCAGPESAATAAVMPAWRFASVLTTTLAANDDAFEPCSACSTMSVSINDAASSLGASPLSMYRKFAAWPSPASAGTGSRPWRMWWCAVTIIGACEVSRIPLRRVASSELSPVSGSNAASADTAVRSTSMGCASFTTRMTS